MTQNLDNITISSDMDTTELWFILEHIRAGTVEWFKSDGFGEYYYRTFRMDDKFYEMEDFDGDIHTIKRIMEHAAR